VRRRGFTTTLQGWFALSRRYIPIAVATAVLAVVALIGYAWPEPEPLLPVKPVPDRVLLPNSAGKIVFDHKKHFEAYKVECRACHHEREKPTPVTVACRSCHGAPAQPGFRARHTKTLTDQMSCVTCHHREFAGTEWDHAAHLDFAKNNCAACHHDDDRSKPEPRNCTTCHKRAVDGKKPAMSTAVHARCATADCHADIFAEDSGMKNCSTCHSFVDMRATLRDKGWIVPSRTYADCVVCHQGQAVDDLVPGRMQAFHASCVKCHEALGKGPFGHEACTQCHTK
jgi:hypothetical protein